MLAANKSKFETIGTKVIISDKRVIDICFDKYKTLIFSESISCVKIPTFLNPRDALKFKESNPDCNFLLKPRWGSASVGIEYLEDVDDWCSGMNCRKRNF